IVLHGRINDRNNNINVENYTIEIYELRHTEPNRDSEKLTEQFALEWPNQITSIVTGFYCIHSLRWADVSVDLAICGEYLLHGPMGFQQCNPLPKTLTLADVYLATWATPSGSRCAFRKNG